MKNKQSKGFTLAEVLIAIGVIGIIATLTIPNIVKAQRIKELEAKYQKSYAMLQRIANDLQFNKKFKLWQDEYCYQNNAACKTDEYTGMNTVTKLKTDLAPYFAGAKYVIPRSSNPRDNRKLNSITGVPITGDFATWYNNYAGTFYLADGSILQILAMSNAYMTIAIDINGGKGPSRLGYDVFTWKVFGTKLTPGVQLQADSCSLTTGVGTNCALYATRNECPWDSTKKYWDVECLP